MIKAILIDPEKATIEEILLEADETGLNNAIKALTGSEYLERVYTMANGDEFFGDEEAALKKGITGFIFNGQLMCGKVCIVGVDEADNEGDCRSNVWTIGQQVVFLDAVQVAVLKENIKNSTKFSAS